MAYATSGCGTVKSSYLVILKSAMLNMAEKLKDHTMPYAKKVS